MLVAKPVVAPRLFAVLAGRPPGHPEPVWKSTSATGAPDNSSLSHFSAMTRSSWLCRAVRNRHRHAIEQASRRWRGGRRDDSARTRRKFDFHTGQNGLDLKRYVEQYARFQRPFNSCASVGAPCASSRRATSFTASFGRLSNCWPRAVRETASSSSFLRLSLSSTRGTSITSGAASSAESDGQSPSPSAIDCSGGIARCGASCATAAARVAAQESHSWLPSSMPRGHALLPFCEIRNSRTQRGFRSQHKSKSLA